MKIEKVTNLEVMDFLHDFEISSETSILEEGKEKSELYKIAEARGMQIKGSKDLAIFKTIYAFTDKANSNGAILPKKELLRVLPQIIGKPVNVNHNRRFVVGHYIDYKYKQKDNKVIAYGVFYKSNFGDEWTRAKELLKKKKLSSSFEIWSPDDKREAVGKGKYKLHFMELAGGALIYEDKNNVPAFKDAKVLEMARKEIPELVYASKYNEKEIITSDKDYFRDSVEDNLRKLNEEKKRKLETPKKEEPKPEEKKETPKAEEKEEVKVEDKKTEKPKVEKEVKVEKKVEVKKEEVKKPEPKVEEKKVEPTIPKIKCSNCNEEFEHIIQPNVQAGTTVNCPKCKAILKQDGTMIYPPQIIDFKVSCPSCKMDRWLLTSRTDKEATVRCLCKKEYKLAFAEEKDTEMIDKMNFPYSGSARCSQCGKLNHYEGISGITSRDVKCKKCGLEFPINISEAKKYKIIAKIEEIVEKKIEPKSEKKVEPKVEEKKETKVEDKKIEKPKEEVKVEDKVEIKKEEKVDTNKEKSSEKGGNEAMELKPDAKKEKATKSKDLGESKEVAKEEVKVEEQPKAKETPEVKVKEPKAEETPKAEEAPKTEEKVETAKVDTSPGLNMLGGLVVVDGKYVSKEEAEEIKKAKEKSIDKYAKSKILRKAVAKVKVAKKELETINKTVKSGKKGIKKLVSMVISLKKEVAKIKNEMSKKIDFYKENAVEINKRREELGDFAKDLTDDQILNADEFEKAQLKKENVELKTDIEKSSEVVGVKKKDDGYYAKKRKEINDIAYPKKKE